MSKAKNTTSAPTMLEWQYRTLISELSHVTLHAQDDSCPCNQVHLGDNGKYPGEYCLGKHLLNVQGLALETALMDQSHADMLDSLASEALEHHETAKKIYCKGGTWPDLAQWSRDARKNLEPVYYACSTKKAKLSDVDVDAIAVLMDPGAVKLSGKCDSGTCAIKVSAVNKIEANTSSLKNLDKIIKDVEARAAKKSTAAIATNKTFALGINGVTRYEFEYRIVDLKDLIVSHDPLTFVPNPGYPQELQPRLRERSATQLQVKTMAANLEPDALLVDYRSIDRGAPIVGNDMIVESGNGRVMALKLAAKDHPEVYSRYKSKLIEVAPTLALSVGKITNPALVRVRLTKVSRKQFAQEANSSTSIESSAIEKAKTDADNITAPMLSSLEVLDGENIEDALRSTRNKQFVTSFLSKLPSNEQAKLVDAKGILNQDGVRRAAMAIFVATFKGDTGLRLAEKFFESTDVNVRNVFNGITRSLGVLSQAESLTAAGEREPSYTIGEDLARVISVFSNVKKTPGMTVDKYLKQSSMLDRELNPFQEQVLSVLDKNSRSAKRIGAILTKYAELVINSAPPSQAAFFPGEKTTKEELFDRAVERSTEALLEDVAALMFDQVKELLDKEIITAPGVSKEDIPFKVASDAFYIGMLLDHDVVNWISKKLMKCNLNLEDTRKALAWKPLQQLVLDAAGKDLEISLCYPGLASGFYQLSFYGKSELHKYLSDPSYAKYLRAANAKKVYSADPKMSTYEIIVPERADLPIMLQWNPQEVLKERRPEGTQAALFDRQRQYSGMGDISRALNNVEVAPMWDVVEPRECAIAICSDKNGKLFPGASACGTVRSVGVPFSCGCSPQKPIALVHNHPSGIPIPSPGDMYTAKNFGVNMCVKTDTGIRCFKPN